MIPEMLPSRPDDGADLTQHIAARVRELRARGGLSLDALAQRSGVSRSMLSLIERGETSPTAVVLEKLATGLDVTPASLFERRDATRAPVARRHQQLVWCDPDSGYRRRNVSPAGAGSPIQIVEVEFPPRARVAYESAARESPVPQQVWVIEGSMEVTVGEVRHRLDAGDCLAFVLDRPVVYRNPTDRAARYAVVIAGHR